MSLQYTRVKTRTPTHLGYSLPDFKINDSIGHELAGSN